MGTAVVTAGTFSTDVSLAAGVHNVRRIRPDTASMFDSASDVYSPDLTVDTTAPAAPSALDLAAADDTGSSSTDNITRNTSALTISGSGETGATVTLYDDTNNNGVKDVGEASLGTAIVSGTTFSTDVRSEERRVGKEGGSRRSACHE